MLIVIFHSWIICLFRKKNKKVKIILSNNKQNKIKKKHKIISFFLTKEKENHFWVYFVFLKCFVIFFFVLIRKTKIVIITIIIKIVFVCVCVCVYIRVIADFGRVRLAILFVFIKHLIIKTHINNNIFVLNLKV